MQTILLVLFILFSALTLLGFLGKFWWRFKIADFPRLHYAIALSLIGLACVYYDMPIVATAAVMLSFLNLWRIRHYIVRRKRHAHGTGLKLMSVNAYKKNDEPHALRSYLDKQSPDILLVMEMNDCLQAWLASHLEEYPHKQETYVRDGFRIALFSKIPLKNEKIFYLGEDETPLLTAQITFDGQDYNLFSAHPKPAISPSYAHSRDTYFHEITPYFKKAKNPVIAMGDFNSVPWEEHFETFLEDAGLVSTLRDLPYTITWPTYTPFLGIPMDHILVSQNVEHGYLARGPYIGSDHYPIHLCLLEKE